MAAAVSQEQDPTTTPPDEDLAPIDVTSSLRVRKGATHWGLRRYTPSGFERLAFGLHAFTQERVYWETKEHYTGETILRLFGPGTYQVNWRIIGDGKNQTIGREDISVRGALVGEPANVAPVQAQTVTCRACSADVLGRFCAGCGTPAGEEARRSPPLAPPASSPPPQATPAPAPVLADPMAAFQLGVSFATSSMQSTAQIARADADARAARYEIDMKATLERERMAHEKAMRDQAVFFDHTQRAMPDPDTLVSKIEALVTAKIEALAERLDAIDAALEEDDEDDEDDDEEKPAPNPIVVQGEWTDRVNAAGAAVEKVVAPTISAIGDAIKSMRGNGNGATPHAQSGSGT